MSVSEDNRQMSANVDINVVNSLLWNYDNDPVFGVRAVAAGLSDMVRKAEQRAWERGMNDTIFALRPGGKKVLPKNPYLKEQN